MNRIVASFTESERNIIVFVLVMVAGGMGILQWRESRQTSFTFEIPASNGLTATPAVSPALPAGLDAGGRVDVNLADGKLLETLPGIGPALAGAIVRARDANGAYRSMDDLDKVPGIGPAMMAKLAPLVSFGTASPGAGAAALAPAPVAINYPAPANAAAANPTRHPAAININTATAEQLDSLHGVGPALAKQIIEDRQQRGPFREPADLDRVRGIGQSILQKNAQLIITR